MNKRIKTIRDLSVLTIVGSVAIVSMARLASEVPYIEYKNKVRTLINRSDVDNSGTYNSSEMQSIKSGLEDLEANYEIKGDTLSIDFGKRKFKRVIERD